MAMSSDFSPQQALWCLALSAACSAEAELLDDAMEYRDQLESLPSLMRRRGDLRSAKRRVRQARELLEEQCTKMAVWVCREIGAA